MYLCSRKNNNRFKKLLFMLFVYSVEDNEFGDASEFNTPECLQWTERVHEELQENLKK